MYDVTPVTSIRQTDCGATCLKMLLSYYGTEVELEQLIEECHTGLVGCSGADLKRVGNAHGLDMIAYSMDAEELIRQDRPGIVWWKRNHWCVMCGRDDQGNVVICNPARGRYRMNESIFRSFYTGVALFNGVPVDLPKAGFSAENVKKGAYFTVGGKTYQARMSIARGEPLTGLNCREIDVSEVLNQMNQ